MADSVMYWGVEVIQGIQTKFQDWSDLMIFLSHMGDPRFAFTIYFPVAYALHCSVGVRVMWVAAVAEWLNAVLKWFMYGQRPYWWVHQPGIYPEGETPHLHQVRITCETGPGSPSGHAMITSAVWYLLVSDFLHLNKIQSLSSKVLCWTVYSVGMCAVCVSRLFIATHFPHQVIAGTITGVLLAKGMMQLPISDFKPPIYLSASVLLSVVAMAIFWILQLVGLDPLWSVALATKWCAYREWIHLDTTLFYALVRDVAGLSGLGICVWLHPSSSPPLSSSEKSHSLVVKVVQAVLALTLTLSSESFKPSTANVQVFYLLGFVKHCFTVVAVVLAVGAVSTGQGFKSNGEVKGKDVKL